MPTVEFGAVTWVAAPDQFVSADSIPSAQALGSGAVARAIVAVSIPASARFGNTTAAPGTVAISVRGIASSGAFGIVGVEIIIEGARLNLVATHLKYRASARYQKRYAGHISKKARASYQKRYSSYVLEHEMLVAAGNFAEV